MTTDEEGHEHVDDYPLPGYPNATNQEMELTACIEALRAIATRRAPVQKRDYRKVIVWTDSTYLVDGYKSAQFKWQINGWLTEDGNPVTNATLWKELLKLAGRAHVPPVEIQWVKGHKSSPHNKAVDKLAKHSAKNPAGRKVSVVKVRRKKTAKSIELGSVPMEGQLVTIRIITDKYERPQRMNRYKYEVVSARNPYRGRVDITFSDEKILLSAGHTYRVRFNTDTAAPRVLKVFREV